MERRLLYIVNPISGKGNKAAIEEIIRQKTKGAGLPFDIVHSVANGDYSFLHDPIKEKGYTDVVIAGGDGTINQVVQGLHHLDINFGILPLGSGNGLALSAGIPKNTSAALDVVFNGQPLPTDAFLINNRFACMLCGLGFDAQVAHDFANDPRRGLLTYIKKTVSHFFVAGTYPFIVRMDGKELAVEAFFISIANSNQFGNNFRIAPKASLTDGLLDIVVMAKQTRLGMLLGAAWQVCGFNAVRPFQTVAGNSSVLYFQSDSIHISNPSRAPLHIDGDPAFTEDEIHVKLVQHCFRLLYPQ